MGTLTTRTTKITSTTIPNLIITETKTPSSMGKMGLISVMVITIIIIKTVQIISRMAKSRSIGTIPLTVLIAEDQKRHHSFFSLFETVILIHSYVILELVNSLL